VVEAAEAVLEAGAMEAMELEEDTQEDTHEQEQQDPTKHEPPEEHHLLEPELMEAIVMIFPTS